MRLSHIAGRRIRSGRRSIRLLDPPCSATIPRHFSQNSQLLLVVSSAIPRPQLPFLSPSSSRFRTGQHQISRLITTERKRFIKETARLTVKFSVVFWCISTLASIAGLGILSERQERAFPSPHEWSLYTRFRFRRGKWWEVPENNDDSISNWPLVYSEYEIALERLEDPSKDGAGLADQEEGGILVPGVGKAGFDLTAKSEEWRQGYWEVLMGMARSAEHIEGWVYDKTAVNFLGAQGPAFPPEYITTASNPRPKAPPPGAPEAPDEENCVLVAHPPETFYLKILTSKGFTTNQRLQAALGYGDWLSYKNLFDSAEEMYRWALDIAVAGLPPSAPSSEIIDSSTHVISATAPPDSTTPNLIHASTTLATHYASTGKLSSALPMFLSILRARRAAPLASPTFQPEKGDGGPMAMVLNLLSPPSYPPLPPTGDEPLLRSQEDQCEEAALMNYIGEILFATAGERDKVHREKALGWTREAVKLASDAQSQPVVKSNRQRKKKCEKCEEVGLENWGKMVVYLAAEAKEKGGRGSGWFGGGESAVSEVEKLEAEERDVLGRLRALRKRMINEEMDELDRQHARMFVI